MTDFTKAILAAIGFTMLGALMLVYTDTSPAVAWFSIIFFGGGGVVVLVKRLYQGGGPRNRELILANRRKYRSERVGADAFFAFYGIKIPLDPEDEDILDACGMETDPRCLAAKRVGLQSHSGRMTDGEDYYLYLGIRLGWLGLEHDLYVDVAPEKLAETMTIVQRRLDEAGFSEKPSLHLQIEAQY